MVGCPVDLAKIICCELSAVERTSALAVLCDFVDTLLAEQVTTRQEYLYVVTVLCATSACHLWSPQLVLHTYDVLVEDTLGRPALPHVPILLFMHLSVCFTLAHLKLQL